MVVDTLAQSHIGSMSTIAGSVAGKAEELKRTKYQALSDRYVFTQFGLETLESWETEACAIIKNTGRKLVAQTGEQRATLFFSSKNQ